MTTTSENIIRIAFISAQNTVEQSWNLYICIYIFVGYGFLFPFTPETVTVVDIVFLHILKNVGIFCRGFCIGKVMRSVLNLHMLWGTQVAAGGIRKIKELVEKGVKLRYASPVWDLECNTPRYCQYCSNRELQSPVFCVPREPSTHVWINAIWGMRLVEIWSTLNSLKMVLQEIESGNWFFEPREW